MPTWQEIAERRMAQQQREREEQAIRPRVEHGGSGQAYRLEGLPELFSVRKAEEGAHAANAG